ncbi:HlyD family secretion protein [Vibrio aestuarianus]|nr:HlyD family secretion protein [Vibrio aestuarianus]
MNINRKLLFFPAFAVGVVILVLAINLRSDLPVKPAIDRARLVETVPLELRSMAPLVIGFGKVSPKVEWKAIAEVSGKVVYRYPRLEKGQVLAQGTEILRIDPLDYELKLSQAEADLQSSKTSLSKLNQEEWNLKQTLNIEKNSLDISRKELERKQNLLKRGLTSQSDLDQQTQTTLSQQKVVQEIENQISLMPDEKRVAHAVIKVNQSKLEEAQRLLEKTRIILPETMRVAEVEVEQNQVVNVQQIMVVAHGMDIMEVEAQLSIHDLQTLAASIGEFSLDESGIPLPNMSSINAYIELNSGNLRARWSAKVARVSETVDPSQATAGVILEIAQDYRNLQPSNQPPLVNGMFVKAEIEGQENPSWVIPERALHGDKIYIKDQDQRLQIKPVKVLYRRDNQVIIDGDLEQGLRLILNDLLPAIEGMLLRESETEESTS